MAFCHSGQGSRDPESSVIGKALDTGFRRYDDLKVNFGHYDTVSCSGTHWQGVSCWKWIPACAGMTMWGDGAKGVRPGA